jgi:putative transcriptional regulator
VITHHPSDESLARIAAGTLAAGPRLVIATHLAGCPQCRGGLRTFEAVGGALLDDAPPASLSADAFARALASLDTMTAPSAPAPVVLHPDLPPPLTACQMGGWRSVHPGFRWRRLTIPGSRDANVILLKVAAGRPLPRHGHVGTEYTQVLTGSFSDHLGHYKAGDCIEIDEEVDHQPVVDRDGECVCVSSVEGKLKFSGWIGRLLQPLIGI